MNNDSIVEQIKSIFLNEVTKVDSNIILLKNNTIINLNLKNSIRKWVKQNSNLSQKFSRRVCIKLDKEINFVLRAHFKKEEKQETQRRIKQIFEHHKELKKQLRGNTVGFI